MIAHRISTASLMRLALLFEGGLILVALGLGWLLDTPPFAHVESGWQTLLWGVASTLPPLLVLMLVFQLDYGPFKRLIALSRNSLAPLFAGASLLDLALVSALAGLGEELLFRGVIQEALVDYFSPWPALVIASILFGLVHFLTFTYAVFAALFGFYLGWLLLDHDNLSVPIIVHGLYDFIALVYLTRGSRR